MLAAREVTQASLGFSPNELVFAHTVRGPLAVLADNWKEAKPPANLIDFVNGFRRRLYLAGNLAKERLSASQVKMKGWFDRRTEQRIFTSGDQVLVLFPLLQSPFQAKFSGPYTVVEQLTEQNYLISTPDRRKRTQLCHVNLLKPYYSREDQSSSASATNEAPHAVCTVEPLGLTGEAGVVGEELEVPESVLRLGRLKNSEALSHLNLLCRHLSATRSEELIELINSFPCLFSDTPGCTHLIEHDIDVGDAKPIRQRFYRVNSEKLKHLDAEVSYLLENGLAKPSSSSWSSPCLLVPKADGTLRFCTDYRKVNAVTKPDCFPLPRMEDCIDQVGSARFVSKFDLLKGYWQVPLTSRAREIAAFITPKGLYSYAVMAFGLRNAPATFQRLMNSIVGDLEGCAVYLDDVVLYSDSWPVHLQRMRELFTRLAEARLIVNLAKCKFAKATVTYLGLVVGRVWPVAAKVHAMQHFPVPTTKKELMRFLGLVGYYRSFFFLNFSSLL